MSTPARKPAIVEAITIAPPIPNFNCVAIQTNVHLAGPSHTFHLMNNAHDPHGSPEAAVEAAYEAVRRCDVPAFMEIIEPAALAAYIDRLRTSKEVVEEIHSNYAFSDRGTPNLTNLSDAELIAIAIDSWPSDERNMIVKAVQRGTDQRGVVWVGTQIGYVFDDGDIEMHPYEFKVEFPPREGGLVDRVETCCVAGRWYVVPMPFGVIPLDHYWNIMRFRTWSSGAD